MTTTLNTLAQLDHNSVIAIAAKHGAHAVRVFGSVARAEDHLDSDVDLLVSMERGRDLLDLVALEQELTDTLGRRVEVVTDEGLSPYLKDQILAEAIPL